jgi:hypothetical protein
MYAWGEWFNGGGTSAAAPAAAAVYAMTGHGADQGSFAYEHPKEFSDVTSGANSTCSPSYLCTAGAGYDGPTGIGTPNAAKMAKTGGESDGGVSDPNDGGVSGPFDLATSGPSDLGVGTSTDGGTCSHDICKTGGKLESSCDPCVTKICEIDSYCCDHKWDAICTSEINSTCDQTCP